MGVVLLILGVLYEIILSSASGAVTLPFTDLVATVTPIKPKPLSPESSIGETLPSLPKVPKSSDAILEYYKSQFLDQDCSSIECEFTSPLVLTSSSRALPVPKIETPIDTNQPTIFNSHSQNSFTVPPLILTPPLLSNAYSSKCQSNTSPYDLSQSLNPFMLPIAPNSIQQNYPSILLEDLIYNTPISPLTVSSLVSDYISGITSSPTGTVISLPSINSLPTVSLQPLSLPLPMFPSLPPYYTYSIPSVASVSYPSNLFNQLSYETAASLNSLYSLPYPLRYNLLSLPKVVTPPDMTPFNFRPVSYNDLSSNLPNSLLPSYFDNSYTPSNILSRETPKMYSNTFKERSNSFDSPESCSHPQCVSSCQFSLPSDAFIANKIKPNSVIDGNTPLYPPSVRLSRRDIVNSSPSETLNMILSPPEVRFTEPALFDVEPTSFEFESTTHFMNNLNTNIKYPSNCIIPDIFSAADNAVNDIDCNINHDIKNFQSRTSVFPTIPKVPASVPSFIPFKRTPTRNVVPDRPILPSSNKLFSNILENARYAVSYEQRLPEKCFLPTTYVPKLPQTTKVPSTYINVSPTYSLSQSSSNAVSAINNIVTNLTQSLLSYFQSYLTSNTQFNKRPSNPYNDSQRQYKPVFQTRTSPPIKSFNTPTKRIGLSQSTNTPKITPTNTLKSPASISFQPYASPVAMPSSSDDFSLPSFMSYSPVKDNMSPKITETPPLYPVKVTILPTASFADFSPPRLCLSYLPSPTLPSYLDISSSFTMEPQVIKVKSLNKNIKTIERLLELVFLAELLNGDDYVDWDALDNLLALLCAG